MKAAVLEKLNYPLAIREIFPTQLLPGQVYVKVLASGLCGAQLHEIRGHKGNGKFLPHLMGHEGCGIVKEVGPGVTTVKEGDKVVMHWRPGSGIEVTDVYLGGVQTRMTQGRDNYDDLMRPEDIAECIIDLANTKTFYVNEITLRRRNVFSPNHVMYD